jgi:hypothetical protein
VIKGAPSAANEFYQPSWFQSSGSLFFYPVFIYIKDVVAQLHAGTKLIQQVVSLAEAGGANAER